MNADISPYALSGAVIKVEYLGQLSIYYISMRRNFVKNVFIWCYPTGERGRRSQKHGANDLLGQCSTTILEPFPED